MAYPFSSFYKLYSPLAKPLPEEDAHRLPDDQNKDPRDIVRKECQRVPFLHDLQNEFITQLEKRSTQKDKQALAELTKDEIILKIQSLAQNYYHAIWDACSKEERYILYDLAENGLANSQNTAIVNRLLSKGLLTNQSGSLNLLNESFQNYVLTNLQPEEALEMEREQRSAGTWGKIRNPILLIALALGMFVLVTQEETFNQIVALLSTLAASVPIIIRILSQLAIFSAPHKAASQVGN